MLSERANLLLFPTTHHLKRDGPTDEPDPQLHGLIFQECLDGTLTPTLDDGQSLCVIHSQKGEVLRKHAKLGALPRSFPQQFRRHGEIRRDVPAAGHLNGGDLRQTGGYY